MILTNLQKETYILLEKFNKSLIVSHDKPKYKASYLLKRKHPLH